MTTTLRYPIATAARLAGLSIDTVRAWERRYAAVAPLRGARGRLYTEAEVARLRRLSALVQRGHAISEVAGLSDADLDKLIARSATVAAHPTSARLDASPVDRVLQAIDRFDHEAADRQVARLAALHASGAFVHEVALPLMREAGERWHRGTWSIAQEHMLSAILRAVVAAIARLEPSAEGSPRLVFATPEGEQHEFGILAAAMLAAASRLGVVYLGAGLPAGEVAAAVESAGAQAVVVGVTGGSPEAIGQLAAVRREVRTQTEVWAGGPAGLLGRVPTGVRKRIVVLENFEAFEQHLDRLASGRRTLAAARGSETR
jgi:MerR family transcriptional regulator, light-induced transcriptional regulator